MAEKLSENYRDRIKSYLEAHPELQESQGSEDLSLTDPEKFESSLIDGVKGSLDKFLAVKMPLSLPEGQMAIVWRNLLCATMEMNLDSATEKQMRDTEEPA